MAVAKTTQERIAFLETLFAPLRGKPLTLTFGTHRFENVLLTAIDSQPVTGFKLAPDKREMPDGKKKVPVLIRLTFNGENKLVFVEDRTVWTAITNGVRAKIGSTVVEIRKQ